MASLPTFTGTRTWYHVPLRQEYSKVDYNVRYLLLLSEILSLALMDITYIEQNMFIDSVFIECTSVNFRDFKLSVRHCNVYRVSQEECARLREGVPYVKVYLYNPKHLCPKLNGYGDNGQRKVWSSGGSTHRTCKLTSLIDVCP